MTDTMETDVDQPPEDDEILNQHQETPSPVDDCDRLAVCVAYERHRAETALCLSVLGALADKLRADEIPEWPAVDAMVQGLSELVVEMEARCASGNDLAGKLTAALNAYFASYFDIEREEANRWNDTVLAWRALTMRPAKTAGQRPKTREARQNVAAVRTWARNNGWPDLAAKGRIPKAAAAAYNQAHP